MKRSSKALLWLAQLLVLAVVALFIFLQPSPPDQTQISQQLEAARAAGESHDVGGIMRIISEKYQDSNGLNAIGLRTYLSKSGGNEPVQVTQSIPVITVDGDTATSTSHLRVVTKSDNRVVYDRNVTFHWQREDGTRFLVMPAKVWHVVSADYGSMSDM